MHRAKETIHLETDFQPVKKVTHGRDRPAVGLFSAYLTEIPPVTN